MPQFTSVLGTKCPRDGDHGHLCSEPYVACPQEHGAPLHVSPGQAISPHTSVLCTPQPCAVCPGAPHDPVHRCPGEHHCYVHLCSRAHRGLLHTCLGAPHNTPVSRGLHTSIMDTSWPPARLCWGTLQNNEQRPGAHQGPLHAPGAHQSTAHLRLCTHEVRVNARLCWSTPHPDTHPRAQHHPKPLCTAQTPCISFLGCVVAP